MAEVTNMSSLSVVLIVNRQHIRFFFKTEVFHLTSGPHVSKGVYLNPIRRQVHVSVLTSETKPICESTEKSYHTLIDGLL